MGVLIVVLLSAVSAFVGSVAAIVDARRRTWRMALYGGAALLIAMMAFFGVLMTTVGGSIWHTFLVWPLAAAFVALYLVTRLIIFAARTR